MTEIINSYSLYRHRKKPNKWKVQYVADENPDVADWNPQYKVNHLSSGKVIYRELKTPD